MSSQKFRRSLLKAKDAAHIVQVERKPKSAERLDGFVLRVGAKWVLMARTADGGFFDGFVAFRRKDVKRVTKDASFATDFAKTLPDWPPSYLEELDLATTEGVLEGLSRNGRLFGIEKENERGALWIGTLDEIARRFVYLNEVDDHATWYPAPLGYKLKAITKVSVGTRYMASLAAIAGTRPDSRLGQHDDVTEFRFDV